MGAWVINKRSASWGAYGKHFKRGRTYTDNDGIIEAIRRQNEEGDMTIVIEAGAPGDPEIEPDPELEPGPLTREDLGPKPDPNVLVPPDEVTPNVPDETPAVEDFKCEQCDTTRKSQEALDHHVAEVHATPAAPEPTPEPTPEPAADPKPAPKKSTAKTPAKK
jgi:hypothetical protein